MDIISTPETLWIPIKQGLETIYNKQDVPKHGRYIELYDLTYNFVYSLTGYGTAGKGIPHEPFKEMSCDLHKKVKKLIVSHLDVLTEKIKTKMKTLEGCALIKFYKEELEMFLVSSKLANGICASMNKKSGPSLLVVYDVAIQSWKQRVFPRIEKKLTHELIRMVNWDRAGITIDKPLLKRVLASYWELEINKRMPNFDLHDYKKYFEIPFLKATLKFYMREVSQFLQEHPSIQYPKKVETRLKEEENRAIEYLNTDTLEELLNTCVKVLIADRKKTFQEAFTILLACKNYEDLKRICTLLSKNDDSLVPLVSIFEDTITKKLESCASRESFFYSFLEQDAYYSGSNKYSMGLCSNFNNDQMMVSEAFNNHHRLMVAFEQAYSKFMKSSSLTKQIVKAEIKNLIVNEKNKDLEQMWGDLSKIPDGNPLLKQIVQTELKNLLVSGNYEDLERMHRCLSKFPDGRCHLQSFKKPFEDCIVEMGHTAIESLGQDSLSHPKRYAMSFLSIYNKFHNLVVTAFNNDPDFKVALDRACRKFMRVHSIPKPRECLTELSLTIARNCDILLRKDNSKDLQECELSDALNQVHILLNICTQLVFKFIKGKVVYEKLLSEMSANDDIEKRSMIEKLTQISGRSFTHEIEIMLQDLAISEDKTEIFEQSLDSPLDIDFVIQVLTNSFWKHHSPVEFTLPVELKNCVTKFGTYYENNHQPRKSPKLVWLHQEGKGELITSCFESEYTLEVSLYQMTVLLAYNDSKKWTLSSLHEFTNIQQEILEQILLQLIKCKLLLSSVESLELESTTCISLNEDYKNKELKVNINEPVKVVQRQKREESEHTIVHQRKILIEAAIVRIMKMKKTLKHQQLVSEVTDQLSSRFNPELKIMKECIEKMIERDYMKRTDDDKNTYNYVP